MICNTIILGQPAAQEIIGYIVPADSTARLDFTAQDIAGLKINGNSQLVISFENGGQITIENFQELVSNNNVMYLTDGTVLDASVLTAEFQSPDNFPKVEFVENISIQQPSENTKQEILLSANNKYVCDFNQSQIALIEVVNGDMVLTFADESKVVLNNYSEMMAGELPPELSLADGTLINSDEFLTEFTAVEELGEESVAELVKAAPDETIETSGEALANVKPAGGEEEMGFDEMAALAEQLAAVQPAAGEATGSAGAGGYGFNSAPVDVLLDSPDALGPLNPTALNYEAPDAARQFSRVDINDRPEADREVINLDETVLGNGDLVATGTLEVDYGNDTPGSIRPSGQFIVVGSALNNNLSSQGVDVEIIRTENGYEGIAGAETVFTFVIAQNGDYTYTQHVPFDHKNASDANDVITINLGVVATDVDGDRTQATVSIRIADDASIILSQVDTNIDESDFAGTALVQTGQFNADIGQDTAVEAYAANNIFNASGSLLGGALSSGTHPVTVTLVDNVYTGVANGDVIFTLTLDPETGAYIYEQFAAIDHGDPNDPNDMLSLEFGVTVTDFDGDSADGLITVNIFDGGPSLENSTQETSIVVAGEIIDDPAITVTEINVTDSDITIDQPITSNGVPVTVTLIGDTFVGTSDTNTIFEIEISDDGTFVFTQLDEIDQGDATTPVNITINVEVTDELGNVTTQPLIIPVDNNFPGLSDNANIIKEDPLANGSVTTQSVIDFGGDGAGSADPTGEFQVSGSINDWVLTSNGAPVTVELVGNTYIATAAGVEVFKLEINPANGEYTFTLNQPLDHADGENPADLIELQFGMLVSDSEGDSTNGFISIFVEDGAPIIADSSETIQESDLTAGPVVETGNLNANFNADGGGAVTPSGDFIAGGSLDNMTLTSGGINVVVTQTADGYVGVAGTETVFTLEIDPATGDYIFTQYTGLDHADNASDDSITLTFGAQITDFDGDTNISNIVITIVDSAPDFQPNDPELNNGLEIVGENNLTSGDIVESGKLEADFGGDGPGTFEGIGSKIPTGLTQNGVAIAVTFDAATNSFSGNTAAGANVFTLVIDSITGDYTYTQVGAIDHPVSGDANDVISLEFGVNAVDSEGEATEGGIIINVVDDGPEAMNDVAEIREEHVLQGNVADNDDQGGDSLGAQVTEVTFNGVTTTISQSSGTSTITGHYGTLRIDLNGTYTYTPNDNDPEGIDEFTYTLVDGDGDTSQATLSITVTPDSDPIVTNASNHVDETNYRNGVEQVQGNINVDFQGDAVQSITGNGDFSVTGVGALTSNGVPITVTPNSNGDYIGTVNGLGVFSLEITDSGDYNFIICAPIDHPNTNNPNEAVHLNFGVIATDTDGDAGVGSINIRIDDDGPVATDDVFTTRITPYAGRSFSLDVLSNDSFSEDGANFISDVTFSNGTAFTLDNYEDFVNYTNYGGPTRTVACVAKDDFIDLMDEHINNGGEFSGFVAITSGAYALFNYGDHVEVLTVATKWHVVSELQIQYTLQDGDGDTSTATASSRTYHTPLVLDLDGDGIELINADHGVLFDMDNDGDLEQTGWVASDDAFLVLDKNQDGVINDRSEMFGSTDEYTDGFDNLNSYDSNNDGVIDANDDVFDSLRVWQDLNSDGVTDEGELLTAAEAGVASISLDTSQPDAMFIEGSWISHVGSYTTVEGATQTIVDAWFDTSEVLDQNDLVSNVINESTDVMADLNLAEGSDTDFSLLLEATDDVTQTIEEFIYSTSNADSDVPAPVADTNIPEEQGDIAVITTDMPDIISDQDIIL